MPSRLRLRWAGPNTARVLSGENLALVRICFSFTATPAASLFICVEAGDIASRENFWLSGRGRCHGRCFRAARGRISL
jgi:hypothetical protein